MQKKAVILFSGGIDSTTCLAIAKAQGFACYALSIDYNQKNIGELIAAKKIAHTFDVVEHKLLTINLSAIGGSSLTDTKMAVTDYSSENTIASSYVPARNTILLSIALGWSETLGARDIYIGANAVDYSAYPDCRPDYLRAFEQLANLATIAGVHGNTFTIHTPLLYWKKSQIIAEGLRLGVDYAETASCYQLTKEGDACGRCDSCVYRKKGFAELGVVDPTKYV